MTRVLLADGHRLFADLLGGFLTAQGVDVVEVATTAAEAEVRTRSDRPDLCLVDPATLAPPEPGAVLGRLVATGVPVVVLTGTGTEPDTALAGGAVGYLRKTVSGADLLAALDRVVHGEVVVLAGRDAPRDPDDVDEADARARLAGLRARERECLELIAGGASTEDMAAAMGVTPATVRSPRPRRPRRARRALPARRGVVRAAPRGRRRERHRARGVAPGRLSHPVGSGRTGQVVPACHCAHGTAQSPQRSHSGSAGPPELATSTTSPTPKWSKNHCASAGLRLTHPWETLSAPC